MSERNNGIKVAIAAALGVGAFAAIKYNKGFEKSAEALRDQIVSRVATEIDYVKLAENDGLGSFRRQIPGEWRISSVIADVLVDPRSRSRPWTDVFGPMQTSSGPDPVSLLQVKPADETQLAGLYVCREHTEDPNGSSFFRDMVRMGRVTNWVVGEAHLPANIRRRVT